MVITSGRPEEADSAVVMAVWWSANSRETTLTCTFGCFFCQAGSAARTTSSTEGKAATVRTVCAQTEEQSRKGRARKRMENTMMTIL